MACACSADVGLEVDLERPAGSASIQRLAWSKSDFRAGIENRVGALEWGDDGPLFVAAMAEAPDGETTAQLVRFARDGARLWTADLDPDDAVFELGIPEPSDDIHIFYKDVSIGAVDVAGDGSAVVAVNASVAYAGHANGSASSGGEAARSFLRRYDPEGGLIDTIRLGGDGGGVADDGTGGDVAGDIVDLNSVRLLEDGSAVWSGHAITGTLAGPDLVPVAEGAIGRVSADGEQLWTIVLDQKLDLPDSSGPPEESAFDVHVTGDGGIVLRGVFSGKLVIGDRTASTDSRGSYVARMGRDGEVEWLRAFADSEPLGLIDIGNGIGMTPWGQIATMAVFSAQARPPDAPGGATCRAGDVCLAVLDADGELAALSALDLPDIDTPSGTYEQLSPVGMTIADDVVVVAGNGRIDVGTDDGDIVSWPEFLSLHDLAGNLLDARGLGVARPPPGGLDGHAFAMAPGPGGRVAVGGNFAGAADLGDGPVEVRHGARSQGFVAVYEDVAEPVDVD